MRRIKKCTVFLLLLCLLLNLAGCAAAQKPLRVTLVLKTVTEVAEFWGTLLSGVEKAAEEYGVELKVLTSPREIDIDKQIELIRTSMPQAAPALSAATAMRSGWRWAAPWHPICRRAERSRSFSIC